MAAPKENNTALFVALGAAALLLVAAVVGMKFFTPVAPPPRPPGPAAPSVLPINTPIVYKGVLDEDARHFGAAPLTLEKMAAPFAHAVELDAPRVLKPGESFDTAHLRITARVVKEWAKNESGQGFRYDHLVLAVENRGPAPLAYRIDTTLPQPEKCRSQAAIPHNAVALLPGETAERTECLYHAGLPVTVLHVETVAIPELGYYYVSRLLPSQLGLDARTAAGHSPPKDARPCTFVPWHDIESGGAHWADVVDFYARHNCDEYSFYREYRFRTVAGPLPALMPPARSATASASASMDGGSP